MVRGVHEYNKHYKGEDGDGEEDATTGTHDGS